MDFLLIHFFGFCVWFHHGCVWGSIILFVKSNAIWMCAASIFNSLDSIPQLCFCNCSSIDMVVRSHWTVDRFRVTHKYKYLKLTTLPCGGLTPIVTFGCKTKSIKMRKKNRTSLAQMLSVSIIAHHKDTCCISCRCLTSKLKYYNWVRLHINVV